MQNIDTVKAALERAADVAGASPVVTPQALANTSVTLYANLLNAWDDCRTAGEQQYGTASEVAKRFGRSLNTVKDWLKRLERDGKLARTVQGCPSREGAKGDTLYHFGEVEQALRQVRKDFVASKCIG